MFCFPTISTQQFFQSAHIPTGRSSSFSSSFGAGSTSFSARDGSPGGAVDRSWRLPEWKNHGRMMEEWWTNDEHWWNIVISIVHHISIIFPLIMNGQIMGKWWTTGMQLGVDMRLGSSCASTSRTAVPTGAATSLPQRCARGHVCEKCQLP